MASSKKLFLDANVILEIILQRKNYDLVSSYLLQDIDSINISSLSAHLVMHFGTKQFMAKDLYTFLKDYQMIELSRTDFDWADQNSKNDDFEDALQISCALKYGCTDFVTLDKQLYKDYADSLKDTIKIKLLS